MRTIYTRFALLICLMTTSAFAAAKAAPMDAVTAKSYLSELKSACDRDAGRLWGISLSGPVMFVDPISRQVITNQADRQGQLTERDGVFVGRLPDAHPVANFATNWSGVKWTMLVWTLIPADPVQRLKLILHESFHRIQDDLKFPATNAANDHLDTREGRVWLQMEWRALRKALTGRGAERRIAIEDALVFRDFRHSLFPMSETTERDLEMNEGLAEYTGFRLGVAGDRERAALVARQIETAPNRPTFVRSFAYATGPAYGVLLDDFNRSWRKRLAPKDELAELLRRSCRLGRSSDPRADASTRALRYDPQPLEAAELALEADRNRRIAEYRARLVDGPTLQLPFTEKGNFTFNPSNLVPMEGLGTVYPTVTVSDEWGILVVEKGALLVSEGGRVAKVSVPAPQDAAAKPLAGDGWTLRLNPGWEVAPAERKGSFILRKRSGGNAS